jgi:hypothetical protein
MVTYSLPVSNASSSDGQSILLLKSSQAQPILNIFRGAIPGPILENEVTVDVQTDKSNVLRAKDVQSALGAVGFADGKLADANPTPAVTTIRYAPGSEAAADLVARHLTTAGAVLQPDQALAANRVILVAGRDFTTVMQLPRPPAETTTTTAPTTSSTVAGGSSTTTSSTTSTTVIGITPGETPEGVDC